MDHVVGGFSWNTRPVFGVSNKLFARYSNQQRWIEPGLCFGLVKSQIPKFEIIETDHLIMKISLKCKYPIASMVDIAFKSSKKRHQPADPRILWISWDVMTSFERMNNLAQLWLLARKSRQRHRWFETYTLNNLLWHSCRSGFLNSKHLLANCNRGKNSIFYHFRYEWKIFLVTLNEFRRTTACFRSNFPWKNKSSPSSFSKVFIISVAMHPDGAHGYVKCTNECFGKKPTLTQQ